MKTTQFQQKAKVGVAGLLQNQLMANNNSLPEVGKGATELHYSDRTCYEVIEVSEDKKTVKLEILEAEFAGEAGTAREGHQNWNLKPTGNFLTVIWRQGAWRRKNRYVSFTEEFRNRHQKSISIYNDLTSEQQEQIYAGNIRPTNVVEGITEERFEYPKIKLLFGVKDYYYDWSF